MNKKIINFLNSPSIFLDKKIQAVIHKIPIRYSPWLKTKSKNRYSIVSAVYGVEKYLDDFFNSITNQTLVFEDHIELIMVDDGSLDGSSEVIKKWRNKYPNNIHYIKKENGGQASARNLGMSHVSNDWVTFIDPDDFISKHYFESVDQQIAFDNEACLISCNFIFYQEATGIYNDNHPLNYRFKDDVSTLSASSMEKFVQLSVNSAFFLTQTIQNNNISMDVRIKPNFEDAHFVGKYLLASKNDKVIFLKKPKYFYRKRKDDSSTLDTAWAKRELYIEKLHYGSLDLLEFSEKQLNVIPEYIQRIVLYDLIWYFRKLINTNDNLSFLSEEDKASFLNNIKNIFNKIDYQVIRNFELVSCDSFLKTGWLSLYKDNKPDVYDVEIEAYDSVKKQVKLRYYFSDSLPEEEITLGDISLSPSHDKIREHKFLDEIFVLERIIWISLEDHTDSLTVSIGGKCCALVLGDSVYQGTISPDNISHYFEQPDNKESSFSFGLRVLRGLARLSAYLPGYQGAWVFMDRDTQADDNAEHLYRYIREKNSRLNARFILRKTSHDWNRLKKDGFNLIPFGSIRHMILMFNAKNLISSHADNYVVNFPPQNWFRGILSYRFTFLQHGIIKHDISNWLNKKQIDLFVTASESEFLSIGGKRNSYKYSSKEVVLTGLARHDKLLNKVLSKAEIKNKTLLVMPTWRQNLVGKSLWMSSQRQVDEAFYTSDYALNWKSFLNSEGLKKVVQKHNLKVVFFLHANLEQYLDWFDVPSYVIKTRHNQDLSIQDLFVEASMLVTDYSSVAFEVAYLHKPVIYYQFDKAEMFSGLHTTQTGYFDYEKDGFGPICENQDDLLLHLKKILMAGSKLDDEYRSRVKNTFKYRDGNCCQRTYEAILNLDISDVTQKNNKKKYR